MTTALETSRLLKSAAGFAIILFAAGFVIVLSTISLMLNFSSSLHIKRSISKLNRLEGFPTSEVLAWHGYYRDLSKLSGSPDSKGRTLTSLDSKYDDGLSLSPDPYSFESYESGAPLNLATTLTFDSSSTIIRRYSGENVFYSDSKGGALPHCGQMDFKGAKSGVRACLRSVAGGLGSGGGSFKMCGAEISFAKRAYCRDLVVKPLGFTKPVTLISTQSDLQSIGNEPGNFELANDIDCGGQCMQPQGSFNDSVLDGKGHAIKNFNQAIFTEVRRSWILNLRIEDVKLESSYGTSTSVLTVTTMKDDICIDGMVLTKTSVSGGTPDIAGLIPNIISSNSAKGPSALLNIASDAVIFSSTPAATCGGILAGGAGGEQPTHLENLHFCGNINNTDGHSGGIAGMLGGVGSKSVILLNSTASIGQIKGLTNLGGLVGKTYGNVKIVRSQSSIQVTGDRTNPGSQYVGGLVGYLGIQGEILDSYATGSVEAVKWVGGLAGIGGNTASIKNSYALGKVTSGFVPSQLFPFGPPPQPGDSGGLVSGLSGSLSSQGCYWDTEKSTQNSSGTGEGKTSTEMKSLSTFIGWDFEEVWTLPEGAPPRLKWEK